MKQFLLNRLGETSTWRGLILCATAFDMQISPEQAYAIASLGMAMVGGVGIIAPDKLIK